MRRDLITARMRGEKDVLLVIASMPGANARVVRTIAAMGGLVQYRDDDVDYVRARVPVDSVEKLVRHADVYSLDISRRQGPDCQHNGGPDDFRTRRRCSPQRGGAVAGCRALCLEGGRVDLELRRRRTRAAVTCPINAAPRKRGAAF